MANETKSMAVRKQFTYYAVTFSLVTFFLLVVGEIMVRGLVPETIYLPITNIFRDVGSPVGYTYRPNYNGTAFGVDLKTNSLGFRGPEWALEKEEGIFRIILIGDSHAFGYGVSFKDTFGERLAAIVRQKDGLNVEVLNMAVNGYNSHQELNVLQHYALRYHPDLLIVLPCSNDHEQVLSVDDDGYLNTSQGLHVQDYSVAKLNQKTLVWLSRYSRLVYYIIFLEKKYDLQSLAEKKCDRNNKIVAQDMYWMGPFPDGTVADRLQGTVYQSLKSMIAIAKENNIPILMANFNAFLDYRQMFKIIATEESIPSLELLALFPEVNNWEELQVQYGLGWNNHLNAKAHERWAVALYELIKKNKFFLKDKTIPTR